MIIRHKLHQIGVKKLIDRQNLFIQCAHKTVIIGETSCNLINRSGRNQRFIALNIHDNFIFRHILNSGNLFNSISARFMRSRGHYRSASKAFNLVKHSLIISRDNHSATITFHRLIIHAVNHGFTQDIDQRLSRQTA